VIRHGWIAIAGLITLGGLNSTGRGLCLLPSALVPGSSLAAAAGAQRPFEEVVRDLQSPDPDTRVAAMRALAVASYPESMAPIAQLLTDPVDALQLEAIDTLLSFVTTDQVATSRRVALVVEVRDRKRAEGVFDLGPFALLPRPVVPEVVAGLSGAMRDQNARVRFDATYAMGVLVRPPVDEVATGALAAALRDEDAKVRLAAARVAGALRATGTSDALFDAVNDRRPDVKAAAMRALGDLKDTRAVQALTEQFEYYQRGELARAALDGLGRIGHASSVPLFQAQLTSKDPVLRRVAAEGLARSGQASLSLPTLEGGAEDRDKHAALAFAYALQSVGRPAMDRLVAGFRDPKLQPLAMLYLTELGEPVARQLGAHLRDPEPMVRQAIAMVLGVIGGNEALFLLERAKQDPDTDVARAVERAIARARMPR
jgi:HEAT repeat protein